MKALFLRNSIMRQPLGRQ